MCWHANAKGGGPISVYAALISGEARCDSLITVAGVSNWTLSAVTWLHISCLYETNLTGNNTRNPNSNQHGEFRGSKFFKYVQNIDNPLTPESCLFSSLLDIFRVSQVCQLTFLSVWDGPGSVFSDKPSKFRHVLAQPCDSDSQKTASDDDRAGELVKLPFVRVFMETLNSRCLFNAEWTLFSHQKNKMFYGILIALCLCYG